MERALSASPAEGWPSFHLRPSTAITRLSPSPTITQLPTIAAKVVGSAPTVSAEKSKTLCAAACAPFDRHGKASWAAAPAAPSSNCRR